MSTPTHSLTLCGVVSESKRIISSQPRHFSALSLLFLLPLSFTLVIYPPLLATLSQPNSVVHHRALLLSPYVSPHFNAPNSEPLLLFLPIIYTLLVTLLSICAISTITYSTVHGFYGRPVEIVSSLKSILFSIFPLLSVFVVTEVIIGAISLIFVSFAVLVYKGLKLIGFEISNYSNFVFCVGAFLGIMMLICLIYLQLNWVLSSVIAVVESKWGYEPLRRSSYLIEGVRGVAFSVVVFYGAMSGILIWGGSTAVANAVAVWGWTSWATVFQTVATSCFATMAMQSSLVATAVLYMNCKALHGEVALEIDEEIGRDYVSLPLDDDKIPHVDYVVQS